MLLTRQKKNIFLYFFTKLKTYHLSYSIHSRYQLNNITLPLIFETLDNEDYSSAHMKSLSSHARQRPATKSYDKDVSCVLPENPVDFVFHYATSDFKCFKKKKRGQENHAKNFLFIMRSINPNLSYICLVLVVIFSNFNCTQTKHLIW